jgi:hypothetical protein
VKREDAKKCLTNGGRKTTEAEIDRFLKEFEAGTPIMPVNFFCDFLTEWANLSSAHKDVEAYPEENKIRSEHGARVHQVFTQIRKSNLLARTIYGGDPVRKTPCPHHKGRWSGCMLPEDTPCKGACMHGGNVTGWLPEGNEYIDRESYLLGGGWSVDRSRDDYLWWTHPALALSPVNELEAMRLQMADDVKTDGRKNGSCTCCHGAHCPTHDGPRA